MNFGDVADQVSRAKSSITQTLFLDASCSFVFIVFPCCCLYLAFTFDGFPSAFGYGSREGTELTAASLQQFEPPDSPVGQTGRRGSSRRNLERQVLSRSHRRCHRIQVPDRWKTGIWPWINGLVGQKLTVSPVAWALRFEGSRSQTASNLIAQREEFSCSEGLHQRSSKSRGDQCLQALDDCAIEASWTQLHTACIGCFHPSRPSRRASLPCV